MNRDIFNFYQISSQSRSSYRYLYSAYKRVLLNVSEENEQIFSFVEELQQIRKLRQDILRMKVYLSCCPDAAGARLLLRLQERQHFVESADEYRKFENKFSFKDKNRIMK